VFHKEHEDFILKICGNEFNSVDGKKEIKSVENGKKQQ